MKIYKAGTKVRLYCSTHDFHSKESDLYTLEHDMTEDEINSLAEEYMWNTKEPEWWFEVVDEEAN